MTPGVNVIKLRPKMANKLESLSLASLSSLVHYFQVGPEIYSIVQHLEVLHSDRLHPYYKMLDRLAMGKHSSLSGLSLGDKYKDFKALTTSANVTKLFSSSLRCSTIS
jgi:hypothetical protein